MAEDWKRKAEDLENKLSQLEKKSSVLDKLKLWKTEGPIFFSDERKLETLGWHLVFQPFQKKLMEEHPGKFPNCVKLIDRKIVHPKQYTKVGDDWHYFENGQTVGAKVKEPQFSYVFFNTAEIGEWDFHFCCNKNFGNK